MEAHLEASKGVNVACAIVAFVLSMTLERLVIWSFVPVYGSVPVYSAFSASWMVTHELIFIAFALCALSVRRLFPVGYLLGYKIWCGIVLMSAALLLTLERPGLFRSSRNTIDIHIIHFFVSAFEGLLGVIWILLPFDSSPELLGQYTVAHRILAGNIIFQDVRSYTLLTLFAIRAMLWYGIRQDQLAVGIGWFREHVPSIATVNRSLLQFVVLGLLKLTVSRILHSTGRHVLFAATVFLALGAYCSSLHGVNVVLGKHNFVIRDRLESNTGYLSVLENTETGLRVLRHDHSLLGGVWLLTPERRRQGLQVEESVYSVFYMLEAVKLMEVEGKTNAAGSSSPLNALFIGLGIGTAPSAFATHRINTTAVELDPGVSRLAKEYFSLNAKVNVQNEDALKYVQYAQLSTFDYIVHDVFAGGAEPRVLFTNDFLQSLKRLLKPNGFIAVNYAGNLNSISTLETLSRINAVFGKCRTFRDNEQPDGAQDIDFANFVVFCSSSEWQFKHPTKRDFLRSSGRQQHLLPRYEVTDVVRKRASEAQHLFGDEKTKQLEYVHNARRHRQIMRTVLPDAVWENY